MTKKPTLSQKIAAWKQAKDIVLDDLKADVGAAPSYWTTHRALLALLSTEAGRIAVLMAPWSVEEE